MSPLDLLQTKRLLSSTSQIMSSLSLLDHLGTQLGVYTDDLCTCYKKFYGNRRMLLLFKSTKITLGVGQGASRRKGPRTLNPGRQHKKQRIHDLPAFNAKNTPCHVPSEAVGSFL